jgi:lariat debranching enzyme
MMSHDWPRGVTNHGNTQRLLRYKKHFREEVEQDRLGSGPTREVLDTVRPEFWFAALVPHAKKEGEEEEVKQTKFLALDKCLPRRQFLQVVELGEEVGEEEEVVLRYDPAWLAILRSTNHLLSVEKRSRYMPGSGSSERFV